MSYVWDHCLPLVPLLMGAVVGLSFQAAEGHKIDSLLPCMARLPRR